MPVIAPEEADPRFGPMLDGLTACVREQLVKGGRPVCRLCLVWADQGPSAECDCECEDGRGSAWVRLVALEPVASRQESRERCHPWQVRAVIEVGVSRCVPVVGEDGRSPVACEELSQVAWGFLKDARLLRQAVRCCPALARPAQALLIRQESFGPQGGCAGVTLQFSVTL